jgi:hypothetical protein
MALMLIASHHHHFSTKNVHWVILWVLRWVPHDDDGKDIDFGFNSESDFCLAHQ